MAASAFRRQRPPQLLSSNSKNPQNPFLSHLQTPSPVPLRSNDSFVKIHEAQSSPLDSGGGEMSFGKIHRETLSLYTASHVKKSFAPISHKFINSCGGEMFAQNIHPENLPLSTGSHRLGVVKKSFATISHKFTDSCGGEMFPQKIHPENLPLSTGSHRLGTVKKSFAPISHKFTINDSCGGESLPQKIHPENLPLSIGSHRLGVKKSSSKVRRESSPSISLKSLDSGDAECTTVGKIYAVSPKSQSLETQSSSSIDLGGVESIEVRKFHRKTLALPIGSHLLRKAMCVQRSAFRRDQEQGNLSTSMASTTDLALNPANVNKRKYSEPYNCSSKKQMKEHRDGDGGGGGDSDGGGDDDEQIVRRAKLLNYLRIVDKVQMLIRAREKGLMRRMQAVEQQAEVWDNGTVERCSVCRDDHKKCVRECPLRPGFLKLDEEAKMLKDYVSRSVILEFAETIGEEKWKDRKRFFHSLIGLFESVDKLPFRGLERAKTQIQTALEALKVQDVNKRAKRRCVKLLKRALRKMNV